jgi:SsrA-binding protein
MAKDKTKTSADGAEFLVCRNPKALHDYEIEERLEAGLVLAGSEVKSLRARRADLEGAYANLTGTELFLHNAHIAPYEQAGPFNHEPKRPRKLLVHKAEIKRWLGKLQQRGYTLVPLQLYFKAGRAKVELGLGKGRSKGDRRHEMRQDIAMKEARAAIGRASKR